MVEKHHTPVLRSEGLGELAGAGPRSSSAGGGRPGNGGSLVDLFVRFFGTSSESGPETRWSGCRLHLVNSTIVEWRSSTSDRCTGGRVSGQDRVRRRRTADDRVTVVAWWICYAFFSEHRHNRSKTEAGGRSNGRAWWTEYRAVLSTGRVTPERSLFRANQRRGCFGITFGWRGVRRFGTPNLRHAPALNWKCEMPRVCKRFVNASLAKGEPIDGMIAS